MYSWEKVKVNLLFINGYFVGKGVRRMSMKINNNWDEFKSMAEYFAGINGLNWDWHSLFCEGYSITKEEEPLLTCMDEFCTFGGHNVYIEGVAKDKLKSLKIISVNGELMTVRVWLYKLKQWSSIIKKKVIELHKKDTYFSKLPIELISLINKYL